MKRVGNSMISDVFLRIVKSISYSISSSVFSQKMIMKKVLVYHEFGNW